MQRINLMNTLSLLASKELLFSVCTEYQVNGIILSADKLYNESLLRLDVDWDRSHSLTLALFLPCTKRLEVAMVGWMSFQQLFRFSSKVMLSKGQVLYELDFHSTVFGFHR